VDLGLAGRAAIVTGGSGDIGRAVALLLAREGATVAIADVTALADAVARDGLRVNSVSPQGIDTALVRSLTDREASRPGGPPDVAAFLVSDRAGFVAGTSVSVDGGYQRYVL
jgi:3-oxoacyl-[acyl-carrier protein] reductase